MKYKALYILPFFLLYASFASATDITQKKSDENLPPAQDILDIIAKEIKVPPKPKGTIEINHNFGSDEQLSILEQQFASSGIDIQLSSHVSSARTAVDDMIVGYSAAESGHYEASIAMYKKALAADPKNISALYSLGVLYHKLNQFKEAELYYKEVLKVSPDDQKALHNFLAVIGEQSPTQGLNELMSLMKVNPNYSPVLAQIGIIYAKQKNYTEAERYLKKAISLSQNPALYKYNLAVMYDKNGKSDTALKLYKEIEFSTLPPQNRALIKRRIAVITNRELLEQEYR